MNRFAKKLTAPLLALFLVLSHFSSAFAETGNVHYVALGDSVAAGQTPDRLRDKSYADFIAQYLQKQGKLHSFTKEFAIPGYTSSNILSDIELNKVWRTNPIQEEIKKAGIITIQAGANDFLKETTIDYSTGKLLVNFDSSKAPGLLNQMRENITAAIQKIKELNRGAKLYVLGYYYPFPYMESASQQSSRLLISYINSTLKSAAMENGAVYISVEDLFDQNSTVYLPNPKDVHPSLSGHKLIASQFLVQAGFVKRFNDVPSVFWAEKEIYYLAKDFIIEGRNSEEFKPSSPITRAEAAIALQKAIVLDESMPLDPGFKDVPKTHKAYYAIAKLTQAGVFNKGHYFKPNDSLTRAQMSKIFTLAFKLKTADSTKTFKDIPANFWAKKYVDALTTSKVTTGYADNTFKPNNVTTRAQFAVFLYRSLHVQ